jgi:aminoglycoside 6-adenylyltransferase
MIGESDVLHALVQWAEDDDNIRAIIVNGSRGDPGRVPDDLSDYDVAVLMRNPESVKDDRWISRFGDIMVRWPMTPGDTGLPGWITQLVLFRSGLRIDFQFGSTKTGSIECAGPFHCVLVDRDQLTEAIERRDVPGTSIDPPTEDEFIDRINAFWWDIPYVAKALRRDELDYARYIMDGDTRFEKLHPLIRWKIGMEHGSSTDVGIFGRWFQRYLDDNVWARYLETFSGADSDDQWRAMFAMCRFVEELGTEIAGHYGFEYPDETGEMVTEYLQKLYEGR